MHRVGSTAVSRNEGQHTIAGSNWAAKRLLAARLERMKEKGEGKTGGKVKDVVERKKEVSYDIRVPSNQVSCSV
jgi:hypothetical protein